MFKQNPAWSTWGQDEAFLNLWRQTLMSDETVGLLQSILFYGMPSVCLAIGLVAWYIQRR